MHMQDINLAHSAESKIQCPQCGSMLAEPTPHCPQCGKDLTASYPRDPADGETAPVKPIAKSINNICALFWIVVNLLYIVSLISRYEGGTLLPTGGSDNYQFGYMVGLVLVGVLIVFMLATAVNMMMFRKSARQSAVVLSWIGTVIFIISLMANSYSLYLTMQTGDPNFQSAALIGSLLVTLVSAAMTFLTRWSIRNTKALQR
jgi:hypothetical protein